MASIVRSYKKFLAISCSHGHLADPEALKAVLKFAESYKPHTRIHCGDYVDTAAFRSGAKGSPDETVSLESDISSGVKFLKDYRPDVLFNGNHDFRLWKSANHHSAIIAECASSIIRDIRKAIPKSCTFIESYDVQKSTYKIGDATVLHGFKYNINAIRDTAKTYGKCMFGHLHRVGIQSADRSDKAVGYCIGWLGDPNLTEYAHQRTATLEWQNGFAWGEYSDDYCHINLCAKHGPDWRLPL